MGLILTIDDFEVGRTKIALDPEQETDLESYIEQVENDYLPKLFGVDLYNLFVIDFNLPLAGTPKGRFIIPFNEFNLQNDCVLIQSIGIEEMLKCFVYYLYLRDDVTRSTTVGLERILGENSEKANGISHDLTSRYNEGVDAFRTIQHYMSQFNAIDYPEYKGVNLSYANVY